MRSRSDIREFIIYLEEHFPVNNWKINNLHLWPILRIKLFFYLINKIEKDEEQKKLTPEVRLRKYSILTGINKRLRIQKTIFKYFFWRTGLPKKDFLFVGADSHRVNYKGARFNRYFDIIIEKEKIKDRSIYFEYASDCDNQYNKKSVIKFEEPLKGFLYFKKSIKIHSKNFEGYENFLNYLEKHPIYRDFIESNSIESLLSWYKNRFGKKLCFFKNVLNSIKPKQVAVLCYYSENLYALIAAANNLEIKTIEMQHGPQTDIHLSYGSWSCIPEEGYMVMPRIFWNWDNYSQEVLQKWINKNNLYSSVLVGNPWVDYWKQMKNTYKFHDFILYSLQPNPITLDQLFTPEIINCIKKTKWKWFIRLHPRQMDEIDKIKNLLEKNDILHLVNIENATNDPLPLLLTHAKIHITHSSGTALEAVFFDLKTILINEIGAISFPHMLENGMATYIDYRDEEFKTKLEKALQDVS